MPNQTRSANWMFTINNPLDCDFQNIKGYKYMIWQLEAGEETGTVHAQGYVVFNDKKEFSFVKNSFPHGTHLEYRQGKHSEAKGYCSKKDTRLDGPYEFGNDSDIPEGQGARSDMIDIRNKLDDGVPEHKIWQDNFSSYTRYYKSFREYRKVQRSNESQEYLKKTYSQEVVKLKEWQSEVCELLGNQSDRKILWVYDNKGNNGKTYLSKCILANFDTFYSKGGKAENIAYDYNYQEYVIFDFPRDKEEYVNYSSIEQFKDGFIQSTKYEPVLKITKPAKVVCFANFLPDKGKLSMDRWVVKKIVDNDLVDAVFDLNLATTKE